MSSFADFQTLQQLGLLGETIICKNGIKFILVWDNGLNAIILPAEPIQSAKPITPTEPIQTAAKPITPAEPIQTAAKPIQTAAKPITPAGIISSTEPITPAGIISSTEPITPTYPSFDHYKFKFWITKWGNAKIKLPNGNECLAGRSFIRTNEDLSYLFVNTNDFIIKANRITVYDINEIIYFHKVNCKFYMSGATLNKKEWYVYDNSYFRI